MEDIFTEPSKMKSHTHAGIWKQTLLHYFDFAKKKWHIDGGYKVPIICYVEQLVPEGVTTLASAEEIAKQVIDIVNTFRQQHHFTIFGVKPPGQSPKPTLPGAAPAPMYQLAVSWIFDFQIKNDSRINCIISFQSILALFNCLDLI